MKENKIFWNELIIKIKYFKWVMEALNREKEGEKILRVWNLKRNFK